MNYQFIHDFIMSRAGKLLQRIRPLVRQDPYKSSVIEQLDEGLKLIAHYIEERRNIPLLNMS